MYRCILLSLALVTIYKHNIKYIAIVVNVKRCGESHLRLYGVKRLKRRLFGLVGEI